MKALSPADRRTRAGRITVWSMAGIALMAGWATQSYWTAMLVYYVAVVSLYIGQRIQRIGRS